MTFLPAAITICRARDEHAEIGFAWGRSADTLLTRWHGPILMGFAALVVLALALAPRLTFDSDPLDTQSPNTEAMRTLRDLMNQPLSNPYSIDILAQQRGRGARAGDEAAATADGLKGAHDRKLRARGSEREARAGRGRGGHPGAEPAAARAGRSRRHPPRSAPRHDAALAQINPALHLLPHGDPLNAIAGDLERDRACAGQHGARGRWCADTVPAARARPAAHRTRRHAGQRLIGARRISRGTGCCRTGRRAWRCCPWPRRATARGCTVSSRR